MITITAALGMEIALATHWGLKAQPISNVGQGDAYLLKVGYDSLKVYLAK